MDGYFFWLNFRIKTTNVANEIINDNAWYTLMLPFLGATRTSFSFIHRHHLAIVRLATALTSYIIHYP